MAEPLLSREISRELVGVNRRFVRTSSDVDCADSIPPRVTTPIVGVADLLPTQEQHTASLRFVNR